MSRRFAALLLGIALASAAWAGTARAEEWDADEERLRALAYRHCDPDERARLLFLERRMEDHATYATWWRRGWNSFYTLGIAFETTRAVLENDHRGARANHIASASKAVVGLARGYFSRPIASKGLPTLDETIDHLEEEGHESVEDGEVDAPCRRRLEVAQAWLEESAKQSHRQRWGWIPRSVNLALNGVAAVVVAETYDYDAAYLSGAIGIAVGELRLWSYPYQAQGILEDYERSFDSGSGPVEPETSWSLEPWGSGARFVVRF